MQNGHDFAEFAALYEQMEDWEGRLATELPFYRKLFGAHSVNSVLEVSCGPGRYASAFADWGLAVTAVDPEEGMLSRARQHAKLKEFHVDFVQAYLLDIATKVHGPFDAIVCVDNSFPSLRGSAQRLQILKDFAGLLSADGILILHLLNYGCLLESIDAGRPPRVRTSADGRMRFVKSFHRVASHLEMSIEFKRTDGPGGRFVHQLYPVSERQLRIEIESAGMLVTDTFGDYEFREFRIRTSEDLIMIARGR